MSPAKPIYKIFLAFVLLAHSIALLSINDLGAWREIGLGIGYLGACLLWRELYFGERYLFVDSQRAPRKWRRRLYFLFGLTSHDEEVERLERKDLHEIASRHRALSALAFASITAAFFLIARRQGLAMPRGTILLGVTGFVLASGTHLRHLFFALALSAPPVLVQAWTDELSRAWLSGYVTILFLALMVHRFLETVAQTGGALRLERLPIARAMGLVGLFLGLLLAFDFILPRPAPPQTAEPLSEKLARKIADTVVERQIRQGRAHGERDSAGGGGGRSFAGGPSRNGSASPQGLDGLPPSQQLKELNADELDKLSEESRQLLESVKNMEPTGRGRGSVAPEELEKFLKTMPEGQELSSSLEKAKNLKPEDIQRLSQAFERFQETQRQAKAGAGGRDSQQARNPSPSQGSRADSASAAGPRASPSTSPAISPATSPATSVSTPTPDPQKKKEDLSKELAVWIRFAAQMGRVVLIVSLLVLAYVFFARTRKKGDEKKVQRIYLSREARRRLRELLAEIKTRRLAASEEIIETYNALLMIFAESHFPRGEDTPVSLFADTVRLALPPLGPSMQSATECFEQTLYGGKSATAERLQAFRESARAIVRYFNI